MLLDQLDKCPYCSGDTFTRRTVIYQTTTFMEHFFFDNTRNAPIMPSSHDVQAHEETCYYCASCLKLLCKDDDDLTKEAEQRHRERKTRKRPVIISAADTSARIEALRAAHIDNPYAKDNNR